MKLFPNTLKSRLILMLGLVIIGISVPGYLYIDQVFSKKISEDKLHLLQTTATSVAALLHQNLRERQREIHVLANSPFLRNTQFDADQLQTLLNELQASYPNYAWIGYADGTGTVLSSTKGLLKGADVSSRPWFVKGLKGPYLGDLHEAKLLGSLLPASSDGQALRFIDFTAPVVSTDGQVRGVLGAHAYWSWAKDIINIIRTELLDQKSIEIFIVDKQGAIIFPQVAGLAPQAPQAVLSNTTSMEGWGNSLPYGNAVVPVAEPIAGSSLSWSVVVRQPVDVMLTDIHVLKKTLLASVLVVTLLTLFAIWAIAVRLSRPVEKLSQFAQQVEAGDHDAIPEISGGTHEVQQAITAVRKMSLTLIQGKQALWDANRDLEQKVAHRTEELHRLNQQLEILARTDALTGLPNRLATDETLNMEFTWFKRSHQAYSVLMMDIDHFKRVNDTYGHPVGDSVLRHFATIIRHNLRESDFVGRFGGEEFMVLLPMTELAQALAVAEKIRASVEAQPHAQAGKMTVSIGAGVVQLVDQDAGAAVGRADLALYSAKTSGRNRVM